MLQLAANFIEPSLQYCFSLREQAPDRGGGTWHRNKMEVG
jgi:hypothetical protein